MNEMQPRRVHIKDKFVGDLQGKEEEKGENMEFPERRKEEILWVGDTCKREVLHLKSL